MLLTISISLSLSLSSVYPSVIFLITLSSPSFYFLYLSRALGLLLALPAPGMVTFVEIP